MFIRLSPLALVTLLSYFGILSCEENNCGNCALTGGTYACLDEVTYGVCYGEQVPHNNAIRPCPPGRYCVVDEGIFCSPKDISSPTCVKSTTEPSTTHSPDSKTDISFDENNCGSCALTGGTYACLDEVTYGVCYGEEVPHNDAIRPCPAGRYCVVDEGVFCSPKDISSPTCVKSTTEPSTTESTEASTGSSTEFSPTQSIDSTTDFSTEPSPNQSTDSTTDISVESSTTEATETSTDSSTEISPTQSIDSTTDSSTEPSQSTDSTTDISVESSTTESTESSAGSSTEFSTTESIDSTTDFSTEPSPNQSTDSTTDISVESSTTEATEASTDSSTEISPSQSIDSTTDSSTETSQSTDSTTDISVESSTTEYTESSTGLSTEFSTTESIDSTTDSSTELYQSTDSTTDLSVETSTTEATETSTDHSTVSAPMPSTDSSIDISNEPSTPATTTASEIDLDLYCAILNKDTNKRKNFRVESDPTCKHYVLCFVQSGDHFGWPFHCNTNEYFDSKTEQCVTIRPDDC